MASDDEVDYMSEDFLKQCEAASSRPGLISDRNRQRKVAMEKKQQEMREIQKAQFSRKGKAELEKEVRRAGLETAVSSDSKGFAMLQKMGYKPGSGLGKSGEGRIEPVPIEIKTDRGGLGRDEVIRKVQERKQAMQEAHHRAILQKYSDVEEFRALQRQKLNAKLDASDLSKSQAACEKLDLENGVEEAAEKWFWRSTAHEKSEDEYDENDQFEPLRKRKKRLLPSEEEEEYAEPEEEVYKEELTVPEKLELLTQYLRLVYSYCTWCGVSYRDLNELQANCPGNRRDEH